MSLARLREWATYTVDKINDPLLYDFATQDMWDNGYTSGRAVRIEDLNITYRILTKALLELDVKYTDFKSDLNDFINRPSSGFDVFGATNTVVGLETKRNTYTSNVNSLDVGIGTSGQVASNTGTYYQRLKQLENQANDLEDRVEGTSAADANGFKQKTAKLESDFAAYTPQDLLEEIYPVGTVLYYKGNFNPATDNASDLFGGGTWVLIEGRVVAGTGGYTDSNGYNSAWTDGFTKGSLSTTINENQVAKHTHSLNISGTAQADGGHSHTAQAAELDTTVRFNPTSTTAPTMYNDYGYGTPTDPVVANGSHNHSVTIGGQTTNTGGSGSPNAISLLQPAEVVFMFKRTA